MPSEAFANPAETALGHRPHTPALAHERFAAAAREWPDRIAIEDGDTHLSYAELNSRADQLARVILERQLGPEPLIGIRMRRSIGMCVAVLGVQKSGGTYVPFLPDDPPERVAAGLAIARPQLLLTDPDAPLARGAGSLVGATLSVERDGTAAESGEPAASLPAVSACQREYVMFTSGSTGHPKAVAMGRPALANLLSWHVAADRNPGARTLQSAEITFDIFFQEMFPTWASGGCVLIAGAAALRDPGALLGLLRARRIERLFLTPSRLQLLAHAAGNHPAPAPALKEIVCAGEPLRLTRPIRTFLARLNGVSLENQYGATETHVVTSLRLEGDPTLWPEAPSVGTPIPGARIAIVDEQLAPVVPGTPGEVCIGGRCLAQGYLGDPVRTAERFVAAPDVFGARLYRTGDVGVSGPGGAIEIRGRSDDQVNVRGFRLELGEVEATLLDHPDVRAAAVVAGEDASGTTSLSAFIAPHSTDAPDAAALRDFLAARLPSHMLPRGFAVLGQLPYTSGGKVDRQRLKDVAVNRVHTPSREPNTRMERNLLAIWRELLGSDRVGIDDDFFELGGHSLLAIRLFERIESELGHRLNASTLDHARTVGSLARLMGTPEATRVASVLVRIGAADGDSIPLVFVHGPGGGVLRYRGLAERLPNASWGLRARGVDTGLLALRTTRQIARDYLTALEPLRRAGPLGLVGYCYGGLVAYELARLLAAKGEAPRLVAMIDTANPAQRPQRRATRVTRHASPSTGEPGAKRTVASRLHAHWRRLGLMTWDRLGLDLLAVGRDRLPPLDALQLAQLAYAPGRYSGRIDLLVAARESPVGELGWEKLASVFRHEIDATHSGIMGDGADDLARGIQRALSEPR